MVGLFGSSKCRPIHISPRLLLSFILPSSHGLMEKPGCTPGTLQKFPPFPHASSSSVTHRGGGCLKNLCPLKQRSMALRTSTSSQAKASLEGTQRGVLVSNRGTWWSSGPLMLVLKHTALRWWRGSLGLSNCYLFLPSGPKTWIGWLKLPFLKMKPNK
jgi:hypothetical protein